MGTGEQLKSDAQTFYPNYVTMGLIQILGCAFLFSAFFVWFIETRSPPAEIREVLFRGFLLRLGQTQLSLLLALVVGTWLGRVRVGAAGLRSSDAWGLPIFVAWDDMYRVDVHSLMGLRSMRVFPHVGNRSLSLPLCVFRRSHMIDSIRSLSSAENVLAQRLNDFITTQDDWG